MKKLLLLAAVTGLCLPAAAQTLTTGPQGIQGVQGIRGPQGASVPTNASGSATSFSVGQNADGSVNPDAVLSGTSTNGVYNPTLFPGSDLGAKIVAANTACAALQPARHCTISIPPGDYMLTTTATLSGDHVTLEGAGAVLHGSPSLPTIINATGNWTTVRDLEIDAAGSTNAVVVTGAHPHVLHNAFRGTSGLYISAQRSHGLLAAENVFDGTVDGCASQNDIGVTLSTDFELLDNTVTDTCGFAFETIASHNGVIRGNRVHQTTLTQTAVAAAGQTQFDFVWPAGAPVRNRVWVEVNGVPTQAAVSTAEPGHAAVTFGSGLANGAVVTALSWTALENIQINSLSYAITSTGNIVDGSGDAGEDVVSDFHAVSAATVTAGANQTAYSFTPSTAPSQIPAVMVNGRALAGDEVALANSGSTWTATLKVPPAPGATVSLVDLQLNQPASGPADFPSDVTFTGEIVRNTASSCIAPEIAAARITITGSQLMDCGLGVQSGNVLNTAIYTANAGPMTIQGVTIGSTRPVNPMQSAVAVLHTTDDDGSMDKPLKISGMVFAGAFSSKYNIPIGSVGVRQSGISIADLPTVDYPEQPNFDAPWTGNTPPNTAYWIYSANNTGAIRDTTNVMGGTASVQVPQGNIMDITPSDPVIFENTITTVSFWAKVASGSPVIRLYTSVAGGSQYPISIPLTDTNWHPYSISVATRDLDNAAPFLRIDDNAGVANVQHVHFSVQPFNDVTKPYTGTKH